MWATRRLCKEMVVEVLNMILSIKELCWDSLVKVLEPLYEYRNTFFLYQSLILN